MAAILLLSPWLALFLPQSEAVAEGPVTVSVDELPMDGDSTVAEDANPDPRTAVAIVDAATPTDPTLPDGAGPKTLPAKPADKASEAGTTEAKEGADQPQARGRTSKEKKPCPPAQQEITEVSLNEYSVEREFIDYYANHIPELMKLGATFPHKDKEGRPDGFRIGLPRCSVLRQGGLKSGDVVHDINGVRINNLIQAVGAYFRLRGDADLRVHILRGGKKVHIDYHIEPREKRRHKSR